MDYYANERDEFVKGQNFSIAAEYLTKYKRARPIFHRQLQTISFKSGKTYAATNRHKKRPIISDKSYFFNLVTLSEDKRLDQASQDESNYIC